MIGKLVKHIPTNQIFVVTSEIRRPLDVQQRTIMEDFYVLYDVMEISYQQMQKDTFRVKYRNGDIIDWSDEAPDINVDQIISNFVK